MQLPTRTRRAAMVLSLLMTVSGSLVYLAAAHRTVDSTVVVPEVRYEKPASVTKAEPTAGGRVASPTVPIVNRTTGDIPAESLTAYRRAADLVNRVSPCHMRWSLLAAIGRVESNHGRIGRAAGSAKIYGIPLDGTNGTARIMDTDDGKLDNDTTFDRAVGPMQFLPSTWKPLSMDGNGDGKSDPQDIHDAAVGAAVYLCAGAGSLKDRPSLEDAIFTYNRSSEYVASVLRFMREYDDSGALAALSDSPYVLNPTQIPAPSAGRDEPRARAAADPKGNSRAGRSTVGKQPVNRPRPAKSPSPVRRPPVAAPAPKDPVVAALSPVQKATATCQRELTAAEQQAVGGLTACVDAVLSGGTDAVAGLLATLGLNLNGLVGK